MKKALCILIVLGFCAMPIAASADFKAQLQTDIREEMGAFYQRNAGSRISIEIMDGLMLHLNQIFQNNIIIPKPKAEKIPKGPVAPEPGPNPAK